MAQRSSYRPETAEELYLEEMLEEEEEEEEGGEEGDGPEFDDSPEAQRARGDLVDEPAAKDEPPAKTEGEDEPPAKTEGEDEPPAKKEGEDEPPAKQEGDDAGKEGKGEGWIPRYRYNQQSQRAKTLAREKEDLEARIKELEGSAPAAKAAEPAKADPASRLDELDKELTQAMVDQDVDKITALRREERQLLTQEFEAKLKNTDSATRTELEESRAYDALVADVEKTYPFMNEDSDQFDQELVAKVAKLRDTYEAAGHRPTEALTSAMEYAEEILEARTKAGGAPAADPGKATQTEAERKAAAKKAAATAATGQPPAMGSEEPTGGHRGETDTARMSEEEFDALPDSKKAELRGDFL